MEEKPRDFVGSLARGLSVILAFDEENPEMILSEVAEKTAMTRAGARRFLLTLVELGYVLQQGRKFRLTPKILDFGYAYMASMPISEKSQPYLNRVTAQTGESCSLAVLDDQEVVYIARSPAKRLLMLGIHVGTRLPAYCTSMGRVLLATMQKEEFERFLHKADLVPRTPTTTTDKSRFVKEIDRVRQQGYAILDQELEQGLRSIAVPVHGADGNTTAALNISTNSATVSIERLIDEFLPVLKQAATEIQTTLGA